MPGLVGSLLLIIVGAIARYAYSDSIWSWTTGGELHSLRVDTIGMILMIAGLVALLVSIAWGFLSKSRIIEEREVYTPQRSFDGPEADIEKEVETPPVKVRRNTRRKSGGENGIL